MPYLKAKEKLQTIQQTHLLAYWDILTEEQRRALLEQINVLNLDLFHEQQELIHNRTLIPPQVFEPFSQYSFSGNLEDRERGQALIQAGKVGCLLVAGGMGTRLGCNGPKGVIPVSLIKHKSLFQLFAEKTLAASKQAQKPLQLAIMTSPQNDAQTRQFFEEHQLFGLLPSQLHFFSQSCLPFLDQNANLFLEAPEKIAEGPDGNGSSLQRFIESGLYEKWKAKGIEYLNYILVDNALADPFDAELVGFHARHGDDVTLKCVKKNDPDEKVGVVVTSNGCTQVQEYNEISVEDRHAKNPDGSLKYLCANTSQFCFRMSFLGSPLSVPLHIALKPAKAISEEIQAWKFEKFIFDCLKYTQKVHALLYPREVCFSPLKNSFGPNSLESVQRDLLLRDQKILEELTQKSAPTYPFELSQEFYYPTPELQAKLKQGVSQSSYIE